VTTDENPDTPEAADYARAKRIRHLARAQRQPEDVAWLAEYDARSTAVEAGASSDPSPSSSPADDPAPPVEPAADDDPPPTPASDDDDGPADPPPPSADAEDAPEPAPTPAAAAAPAAPPRKRGRPPKAAAPPAAPTPVAVLTTVADASQRQRARRTATPGTACHDPDCTAAHPSRGGARGRTCSETGARIYARMSDREGAMVASSILVGLSAVIGAATGTSVAGPSPTEIDQLAPATARIVHRYIGSFGEHADLMIVLLALVRYVGSRVADARKPAAPATRAPSSPATTAAA
jgi:hypothetical protein